MQALMAIAAVIVAGIGQWFNSKPQFPTAVVKLTLAAVGMLLYLLVEQPTGPPGNPAFLQWLEHAWVWALAVPGAASLIGLAPGMQTRNV